MIEALLLWCRPLFLLCLCWFFVTTHSSLSLFFSSDFSLSRPLALHPLFQILAVTLSRLLLPSVILSSYSLLSWLPRSFLLSPQPPAVIYLSLFSSRFALCPLSQSFPQNSLSALSNFSRPENSLFAAVNPCPSALSSSLSLYTSHPTLKPSPFCYICNSSAHPSLPFASRGSLHAANQFPFFLLFFLSII